MVRPSTWKGHLRFAAERVDCQNKKEIINRLFGSETEDEEKLKGRLYFFPTFFEEDSKKDVITPLKRDTRTPARGPIFMEVMKQGSKGEFYLLYVPYPKGKNFEEKQIGEDLHFLASALKLMFYTYGFSAKKTSGFGTIEELKEENIEIYPKDKKGIFSILYTKHNNSVKDGV
jgi:CRISPR-associated protein Cmr2